MELIQGGKSTNNLNTDFDEEEIDNDFNEIVGLDEEAFRVDHRTSMMTLFRAWHHRANNLQREKSIDTKDFETNVELAFQQFVKEQDQIQLEDASAV